MSRKATDLAARAAATMQREPRGAAAAAQEPAPARTVRAKPVRITTDLAPQAYRALGAYCAEVAETLGRAKVPHAEVVRALIAQLDTDPALRDRVAVYVNAQLSK